MIAEPKLKQDAVLQALDGARKNQKIAITGRPHGRAVAVGMLVQNIVADAHVHGHRHVRAPRRRQHAQVAMRKIAFRDPPADIFAEAQAFGAASAIQSFNSPVSRHKPNSPVRM